MSSRTGFRGHLAWPVRTRATAVITTSSGGQVAAICNESSGTTFMSYDGQ